MILTSLLFLSLSWAADKEVSFKDKAHITIEKYSLDRDTNSFPLKCNAYGNLSEQGIKLRLKNSAGINYALDCRASEIGSQWDLVVFKGEKQLTKLTSVASSGSDCGTSYETQGWLQDLNGDRMMDVIERSKLKKVPADCGTGNQPATSKDDLKAYFWDEESLSFKETKLPDGDIKKFKKRFDFSMK